MREYRWRVAGQGQMIQRQGRKCLAKQRRRFAAKRLASERHSHEVATRFPTQNRCALLFDNIQRTKKTPEGYVVSALLVFCLEEQTLEPSQISRENKPFYFWISELEKVRSCTVELQYHFGHGPEPCTERPGALLVTGRDCLGCR